MLTRMNLYNDVYQLVTKSDCVIIPGFGGFVANYQEANVSLRTQEFCPPARQIAFNEALQNNDGVLMNHICQNYDVKWEEADKCVYDFVANINASLRENETLVFDRIGSFTRKSGNLVFSPQHQNLLDSSFGLVSFNFPLLQTAQGLIEIQKPQSLSKTKSAKANKSTKSKRPLWYTISAVAAISGLVFLSLHFGVFEQSNNNTETANIVPVSVVKTGDSVNSSELNNNNSTNNTPTEITENTVEIEFVEEPIMDPIPNQTLVAETDSKSANSHVIAGSFSNIDNANNLMNSLVTAGFNAKVMSPSNGMYRVSVKSYENNSQAVAEVNSLREQTNNQSLWVLNL